MLRFALLLCLAAQASLAVTIRYTARLTAIGGNPAAFADFLNRYGKGTMATPPGPGVRPGDVDILFEGTYTFDYPQDNQATCAGSPTCSYGVYSLGGFTINDQSLRVPQGSSYREINVELRNPASDSYIIVFSSLDLPPSADNNQRTLSLPLEIDLPKRILTNALPPNLDFFPSGINYTSGGIVTYRLSDGSGHLIGQITGYTVWTSANTEPPINVSPEVTLIDPAPSLLTGVSWTASPSDTRVTIGGRNVRGVAADGTAEVLLRITGVTAGQQITLSLPTLVSSGDLAGALRTLDSPTESSQITVVGQSTSPPMAFAVYRAPMDFSDGFSNATTNERSLNIHVQANSAPAVDTPMAIVRPTLILVHGLWDSSASWSKFTPLIRDMWFDTYVFDYKGTNAETFSVNALLLADRLFSLRTQIAADKNIAIGQFDFVAHSMGGNVVRTLNSIGVAGISKTQWNLRKGYVHKLITLGTPHLGSPLAKELIKPENSCVAKWMTKILQTVVKAQGAVGDLAADIDGTNPSAALQSMTKVPTAALAGWLSPSQITGLTSAEISFAEFFCLYNNDQLISTFTPTGYSSIMGSQHDGIVPLKSALNNLPSTSQNTWGDGMGTGAVHSKATRLLGFSGPLLQQGDSTLANEVVDLLNKPVQAQEFVK